MTTFEWVMVSLTAAGFLLTAGGVLGGCIWGVAKIKQDVTEKLEAEHKLTAAALAAQTADMAEAQKTHDRNLGELGLSLRRHIEGVEKKISEVEIWGRDNYALKDDVKTSISELRDDIRALGQDIKQDMRDLAKKIDSQPPRARQ